MAKKKTKEVEVEEVMEVTTPQYEDVEVFVTKENTAEYQFAPEVCTNCDNSGRDCSVCGGYKKVL